MNTKVKSGGRQKGTPNKITSKMKQSIQSLLEDDLLPLLKEDISKLTPYERTKFTSGLLRYFIPSVMPEISSSDDHRPIIIIDSKI